MGTAEHYDVIIVGQTLSGLLSAALLARRRFRVRVLDAPTPTRDDAPLFGLETSPALLRVLEELTLVHDVRARVYGPPTPISIALPDRRFSFEVDPYERAREFAEMMPESVDELLNVFEQVQIVGTELDALLDGENPIPLDGTKARRVLEKFYGQGPWHRCLSMSPSWPEAQSVEQFVRALLAVGCGGLPSKSDISVGDLRTLWHLSHGMPSFRDDRPGFKALLKQKLISTGGTVEDRRKVSHFEVRRNAIKAVVTTDGARFTTDAVVLDGGLTELNALWDECETPPDNVLHELYMVSRGALPESLTSPCGWLAQCGGPAYVVERHEGSMLVSGPRMDDAVPVNALLPLHQLESTGHSQTSHRPMDRLDPFGLFHQGARGRLKNLIFVGEQVLPNQGLESDAWTALNAADILAEALTKRWRFSAQI